MKKYIWVIIAILLPVMVWGTNYIYEDMNLDDNDLTTTGDIDAGSLEANAITETGIAVYNAGEVPGGDLGGTWGLPSVDDDSHAHTTTTLTLNLNEVGNPTADKTFTMGNNELILSYGGNNADNNFEIDVTGNSAGDALHVHQHTGNPTRGHLVHFESEDMDIDTQVCVSQSAADITSAITSVRIYAVDDNDADWTPLLIQDDGSGTPDTLFKIDYTGEIVNGILNSSTFTGTNWTDLTDSGATTLHSHAGGGDITSVGDVASGAAFDGTQGTTLTFNNAGGDGTIDYDGVDFNFSKHITALSLYTLTDSTYDVGTSTVRPRVGYFDRLNVNDGTLADDSTKAIQGTINLSNATPYGMYLDVDYSGVAISTPAYGIYIDIDTTGGALSFPYGIFASANGNLFANYGVWGEANTDNAESNVGIRGYAYGGGTAENTAVAGVATGGSTNYGGKFTGTTADVWLVNRTLKAGATYTFPAADGTSGDSLNTSGAGILSWGARANAALSNLVSVAINTSLISDTANTDDLGSSTVGWKHLFLDDANTTAPTTNGQINYNSTNTRFEAYGNGVVTTTVPVPTATGQLLYSNLIATNGWLTLAGGANGVLVTSATSIPSISTNLPTAVTIGSGYIYRAGGTDVAVADGGTGLSSYTANNLLYASATTTIAGLATANNGVLVTSGTGVPSIAAKIVNANLPTGTMVLLSSDQTGGSSAISAALESYTLAANTYSSILVEAEGYVIGAANTSYDWTFYIRNDTVQVDLNTEVRHDATGAGDVHISNWSISANFTDTGGATVDLYGNEVTDGATAYITSLKVWGII